MTDSMLGLQAKGLENVLPKSVWQTALVISERIFLYLCVLVLNLVILL